MSGMPKKQNRLLENSVEALTNFVIGKNSYDESHIEAVTFVRDAVCKMLKGVEPNDAFDVKKLTKVGKL